MPPCISTKGGVTLLYLSHYLTCLNSGSPQLPDDFADAYIKEFGIPPPPDVITYCRRELYHAVIQLILEGKFAEAYKNGILIKFPDGITRRVFPRFYCYSADYPEKFVSVPQIQTATHILKSRVLIANIKNLGQCPCPRCTTKLAEVQDLGKAVDTQRRADTRAPTRKMFQMVGKARKAIFKGYKVSGSRVERLIGGGSRAPNVVRTGTPFPYSNANHGPKNAFMNCIPNLNIYPLLTVDLLHEVELGVWKSLFTHIIRILSVHSPGAVNELDRRYVLALSPPHSANEHTCMALDSASLHHLERTQSVGFQTMHLK